MDIDIKSLYILDKWLEFMERNDGYIVKSFRIRSACHNYKFDDIPTEKVMRMYNILKNQKRLEGFEDIGNVIFVENIKLITSLTQLKYLKIGFATLNEEFMNYIASMKNLTFFKLIHGFIDSKGYNYLSSMTKLTKLVLGSLSSDVSMEHISKLTQLTRLNVNDTTVLYLNQLSCLTKLNGLTAGETQLNLDTLKCLCKLNHLTTLKIPGVSLLKEEVKTICSMPQLTCLDISRNNFDVESFEPIYNSLRQLRYLVIQDGNIGNEIMKYISSMNTITHLDLESNRVETNGLEQICLMKQLTYLNLNENNLSQLDSISSLTNLIELHIASNGSKQKGLKFISNLSKLRKLNISGNLIGDEGFEIITKSLHQLTKLNVSSNEISDDGTKYIVELENLKELNIETNNIGDETIKLLAQLPNLKSLFMSNNQVTDAGVFIICHSMKRLRALNSEESQMSPEGKIMISETKRLCNTFIFEE